MESLISVIVPVYNAAAYLSQCMDSLVNQTYPAIELIFVNDGSTDASREKLEAFAAEYPQIKVIHQANQGVSAARNAGLSEAKGEFVVFVDADDYVDTSLCEKLYSQAEGKDLVMCQYARFNQEKTWHDFNPDHKVTVSTIADLGGQNFAFFYRSDQLNTPVCKLYRRNLIFTEFDEKLSLGEDLLFNLHYYTNCQTVAYLNEVLYYYRTENNTSLSTRFDDNRLKVVEALYHDSIAKFTEIFGDNFDKDLVKTKYLEEVCLSIKKKLSQEQVSRAQKIEFLKSLDVAKFLAYKTSEWQKTGKGYQLYLKLLELKAYRTLVFISVLKTKLKARK